MKKFLIFLGFFLFLFMALTYWSLSVGPSEVRISEISGQELKSDEDLRNLKLINVTPSNQYAANGIKRFMQGENYRRVWEMPVYAEVFFLDTVTIVKEGGGNQTRSLKIKDKNGILYSLRSINKDPDPLIPDVARLLNLENIIVDGVSAQHPFGALLAASLAETAGILHTHPRIVYVPAHTALGKFAEDYANRLYLLEYETEGEINWTSYPDILKIVETDDLLEMKAEMGDKLKVDLRKLVRARLFDLLIGDWDRHAKQWGWVLQEQKDRVLAIPLPADRDNAFFRIDGVLPTMLTNKLVQPMVRPFEKDIDHIPGYAFYPFDFYFLNNVPQQIFIEEAENLQKLLPNEEIDKAIQKWPGQAATLNGKEIAEKLRHRRDKLTEYAIDFRKEIRKNRSAGKPLKGTEDLNLPTSLQKCFECK